MAKESFAGERMPWSGPALETIPELLAQAVESWPDKIFLEFEGTEYSYRQFDEETNRLAHGLKQMGIAKAQTVATLLDNSDFAIMIWFAINKIGAISVPLNTALKGEFLLHQLDNSAARIVVSEGHYLSRITPLRDRLPNMEKIFCRGAVAGPIENAAGSIDELRSDCTEKVEGGPDATDIALIVYTSGTTGPSKGCMVGQNYMCHYARQLAWATGLRHDDTMWTPLPLFHLGATGAIVLPTIRMGSRVSIARQFSLSGFWPEIERTGATVTLAPASMGVLIAEAPDTEVSLRCRGQLRTVGGVPFSAELAEKWRSRFGIKYVGAPGYGMTELSMVTLNPLDQPSPPGASGRRFADVDVRVIDDNGNECPDGTPGEIICRPRMPHIMFSGYWQQPEASLKAFDQLWFHTGDLGRFDEDGFFFFVDRKKDYMRRRGENISSYELENTFRLHPAIEDLAAHAVPSDVSEDDVKITVVLKAGAMISEEELCRWCLDKLPFYAVPRYVEFRTELPKNPFGRILKYQLRDEGATPTTWDRTTCPSIVVER